MAGSNLNIVETSLKNGLRVLIKEVHSAPVVACYIWYKVGSRNERPGITGISHWVEHMLFKGTKKFPKEEMKRVIERNGGRWNGFTGFDYTAYFEVLPSDKLELGIEMESDRMCNSLFDSGEIDLERTVIISEREGAENSPEYLLWEEILSAAYKAHPYRWGVIGWKSDLRAITREDLYGYYRKHYIPNYATVVLVGDLDPDKVLPKVESYFGGIEPGDPFPDIRTSEPPQYGERRVKVSKQGNAAYVGIAYHIPQFGNDDIYPLELLRSVLGSGKSSRLYKALVEKKLATSVSCYTGISKDPGLLWIRAQAQDGIDPEKVEGASFEEIEKLKDQPIYDDELRKALNQSEANFIYEQEGASQQALRIGIFETLLSYRLLESYLEKLGEVSKSQIQDMAQRYLSESNRTVGFFVPASSGVSGEGLSMSEPLARAFYVGHTESKRSPRAMRRVLDNGITAIVRENRSVPTLVISGRIRAGAMYDPDGKSGVADFTANMLSKGTRRRTWEEIAEETESVGSSIWAWGETDVSGFGAHMLSRDFDKVSDVLADMIMDPVFPADEIDRHRLKTYSQLKSWNDEPRRVAQKGLRKLIYPESHPYGRQASGEPESVLHIGHEDIVPFYDRYYRPDSMIISIVGDIETDVALKRVESLFGGWSADGEAPHFEIPHSEIGDASRKVVSMMDKSQAEISIGHKGISRKNPDYYAANLMNTILGGSAGIGRLFANVRDRQGLAYFVASWFTAGIGDGPFTAHAGVNPGNVDRAIEAILHEIERMKQDGVTEEELADAKDRTVGGFAISIETSSGIAQVLVESELYGLGIDYPERHSSIYRSVTIDQVNEAAGKYLYPDKCSISIAGPYEG